MILIELFHESLMNSKIINERDFMKNSLFVINEFIILKKEEKNIHKFIIDKLRYLQTYHTYRNLSFLFQN